MMTPLFDEIRASDLTAWAKRAESVQWLPSLVRQLVLVSGARLRSCRFLTHEEAARGGWDGVVEAESAGLIVPAGLSAWEISKEQAAKSKAERDSAKRIENPGEVPPAETTLVHVSLRVWPKKKVGKKWLTSGENKQRWEQEQKAAGWKAVRIVDAEDLTTALARTPGVSLWLTRVMGRDVTGASSLISHWHLLATLSPKLTPATFLCGRKVFVDSLEKWITGPLRTLEVHTWSPDDLRDAVAAWWWSRTFEHKTTGLSPVAVKTVDAWRFLIQTTVPLLMLVEDGLDLSSEEISAATAQGHYVILRTSAAPMQDSGCVLGPLNRDALTEELKKAGIDYRKAWRMAGDAAGSGVVLKRLLSGSGAAPKWARGAVAAKLAPIVLVGQWSGKLEGDRERVASVFGTSYSKVEALLSSWVQANDPLVRRNDEQWRVVGPEDAWRWLAPLLRPDHCARFAENTTAVLTEVNPRYNLRAEDRLLANIRGAVPRHSRELHRAMAQALCLLSLRPVPTGAGKKMPDVAKAVVARVMAGTADWRLWASLGYSQVFLAEAAPGVFLKAAEDDLKRDKPAMVALFGQSGDGVFGENPHVNLLWALQGLLWEKEWIARSVMVIADLARRDPGSNVSPRPLGVLHDAFSPWLPQCCLSVQDRCRLLDRILQAEPEIGWNLFRSLLPKLRDSVSQSHRPLYRTTASLNDKVPVVDYWEQVRHVARQLVHAASTDVKRWEALIQEIHMLPEDIFALLLDEVRKVGTSLGDEERYSLWDVLRGEVVRHQYFAKAEWAMRPARLSKVSTLVTELEPSDPVLRNAWLFDRHSLNLPGTNMDTPHGEQLRLREEARVSALKKVLTSGGHENLIRFALRVREANEMGFLVAKYKLWDDDGTIFPHWLEDSRANLVGFAYGYASAQFSAKGWAWLDSLNPTVWKPAVFSILSTLLPFARNTWDRVQCLGDYFSEQYWKRAYPWIMESPANDVEFALNKLLGVGRADAALDCVNSAQQEKIAVSLDSLLKVLEAMKARELQSEQRVEEASPRSAAQHELHLIAETIKALHAVGGLSVEQARRLEALEWFYLPLLESLGSPKFLVERIRKEPAFFVQLVSFMYVPEDMMDRPRKEPSPEQKRKADNAFRLLNSVRELPGTNGPDLDEAEFKRWIGAMRDLAAINGFRRACDNQFGHFLIYSPMDAVGFWPCASVCRLLTDDASDELTQAFRVGLFNNQGRPGVFDRGLSMDSGEERAASVARLRDFAARLDIDFPIVAGLLREVADDQERISEFMALDRE